MKNNLGNREALAENLQLYMDRDGIDRKTLSRMLNIPYTTVTAWLNAETYPRIDKIEIMAKFFRIKKSDLIEPHDEEWKIRKESDDLAWTIKHDQETRELLHARENLDSEDFDLLVTLAKRLKRNKK